MIAKIIDSQIVSHILHQNSAYIMISHNSMHNQFIRHNLLHLAPVEKYVTKTMKEKYGIYMDYLFIVIKSK